MTIPYLCVLAAAVLIYLTKIPVAIAMALMPGGYDNKSGRDQQAKLQGWGKRALAAHQNGFESFPIFAAGVIIASLRHGDPHRVTFLALFFLASRVLYIAFYMANLDKLRSTVWALGMFATVLLFI